MPPGRAIAQWFPKVSMVKLARQGGLCLDHATRTRVLHAENLFLIGCPAGGRGHIMAGAGPWRGCLCGVRTPPAAREMCMEWRRS